MNKLVSDRFSQTPHCLIGMYLDVNSMITADHVCLYNVLWTKATWTKVPAETGYLSVLKLVEELPYKKVHFYRLLKVLIDKGFIERVYRNGKKRETHIKVRFIIQKEC